MDADRRIADLAAAQHGVVSRRQRREAGVAVHPVEHRVSSGLLVPLHAGVYRVPASASTWEQAPAGLVRRGLRTNRDHVPERAQTSPGARMAPG